MNCWEFHQCAWVPGGAKAAEFGVCPAYPDHGRGCFRLVGTYCGGKVQGNRATKLMTCLRCDFYRSLQEARE